MKTRKNKNLERFWDKLVVGVFLIYKDGSNKYVKLPKKFSEKWTSMFNKFDEDKSIITVLHTNPSYDAYELLSKRAKGKSVDYVIENYKKYFKLLSSKNEMKKVRIPY